jgi:prepilin-type N-terminal cleavage/methylation domain-containing protein/prepilin-type processing-associated H-X9-DG protein
VNRRAFTLIELLVVIAVIAVLIAVLLPALGQARKTSRTTACGATQRSIGQGFVLYQNDHKELIIPSYNMSGMDTTDPLDGWAPILDRDGYMTSSRTTKTGAFVCPDTVDIEGLIDGQTGANPDNPKGWMDWPNTRTGTRNISTLIPERGFDKIIRVSYWMNALNPIGGTVSVEPDLHYTASVGYGPGSNGVTIAQTRATAFVRPYQLITTADGVYAGRHRDNRINTPNSRIGYRHPGTGGGAVNAAFADGHVEVISAQNFPRSLGGSNTLQQVRDENLNGKPTVYANPEKTLGVP